MDEVKVILKAVQAQNYDLAQRTVDAEVKKKPLSDVYLSLKVLVASKRNDSKQVLETAERAVSVCSDKTLRMFLLPELISFDAGDLLASAFVRVNRQEPLNHELCETWLEVSLHMGDLGSAQKALMAMQRTTKKPRPTCYQACYIMACENSNAKLFPALAERMLQKFLPAKNAQECFVVAHVRRMKSDSEMIDYLRQDDVFECFVSGSLDLQLLLLDGLCKTKSWQDVVEFSMKQLKRIDSYNYWEALNTAAIELGDTTVAKQFADECTSSNAVLSKVDLAVKDGNADDLHSAISRFWEAYSAKASTYSYLKPVINAETLHLIEPKGDVLGTQVNYAKLRASAGKPLSYTDLIKIYKEHTSEFPGEKTDYFQGTDLLIMASQAILREGGPYAGEFAATVLEYSLIGDPCNFYVKLLLILIYNSLGVTQLATKHYNTLSIRNIQLETLGYLLSTRAGSIAPEEAKAPLTKLKISYAKEPNFGVFAVASLADNSFTQFSGIFGLGQKLRLSLQRSLVTLELIRASRCTRGSVDYTDLHRIPLKASEQGALADNRDFKVISFDDGVEAVAPQLLLGPKQGNDFVRIQTRKEMAYQSAVQKAMPPYSVENIAQEAEQCAELTEIEKWNVRCIQSMVTNGKDASLQPPPAYDTSKPLDWSLFHWCYTVVETVRAAKTLKVSVKFNPSETIRSWASGYQSQLNVWESRANEAFRETDLPGEASKVVRAIKQEHMAKLKTLLELSV